MEDFNIFECIDGIPNKEAEKVRAQDYYTKICNEFKEISKEDVLGYSLQAVHISHLIIDNECDCDEKVPPSYRLYANGTNDKELQAILDRAVQKFMKEGNYFFHYYHHQLEWELSWSIDKYLNDKNKDNNGENEYWCKLFSDNSMTLSGKIFYTFIILHFDKVALETNITYKSKRHPFLDALKHEWSFGKVNDIGNRKINYNELFCRAAYKENSFIYLYGDIFNALSALKYESGENYGSILILCRTKDKSFDEVKSNYEISIEFKHEIENNSYKKLESYWKWQRMIYRCL